MYEVVSIYDPRRITQTVDGLRRHGHWCLRLDIDVVSDSSTWPHDAASLWGLLQLCPRLEILTFNILACGGGFPVIPRGRFNCPLSLLIQVADLYGPTLRRLETELGGDISVHHKVVHHVLSRCRALQVLVVPDIFVSQSEIEGDVADEDIPAKFSILPEEYLQAARPLMTTDECSAVAAAHCKPTISPSSRQRGDAAHPHSRSRRARAADRRLANACVDESTSVISINLSCRRQKALSFKF